MDMFTLNDQGETTKDKAANVVDLQQADRAQKGLKGVQTNLFDLGEIDVSYDESAKTLWTFMTPSGLPNLNVNLLKDILTIQDEIPRIFSENHSKAHNELHYVVFGSRFPNIFCLGGDLNLFSTLIEQGDRSRLDLYAENCVQIFNRTNETFDLPLITIALVQGEALGGGFEAALSFNVIIAERNAIFAFPETLFGLFPAVGAHVKLVRLLGEAQAERMILSGRNYTAEELYELGVVHVLAEPGEGEAAVRNYISNNTRRHFGQVQTYRATREVNPITKDELQRIAKIWVDAAMQVSPQNIKLMRRIASTQARLVSNAVRVAC